MMKRCESNIVAGYRWIVRNIQWNFTSFSLSLTSLSLISLFLLYVWVDSYDECVTFFSFFTLNLKLFKHEDIEFSNNLLDWEDSLLLDYFHIAGN